MAWLGRRHRANPAATVRGSILASLSSNFIAAMALTGSRIPFPSGQWYCELPQE
jgi:hypothetical protein